jgi:hypothetical protein
MDDNKKKEYQKVYYEKNKDNIKGKMKEKILCECGGEYTKYNKNNHDKTKKHIEGIELVNKIKEKIKDDVIREIAEKMLSSLKEKK